MNNRVDYVLAVVTHFNFLDWPGSTFLIASLRLSAVES